MSGAEVGAHENVVRPGRQHTESKADGWADSVPTPSINPADALTNMCLDDALRCMLTERLAPRGVTLTDAKASVTYTGVEHRYTLAKSSAVQFAILQIPRWIIGNDNNMGALLPLGSAFSGMTVRLVSPSVDAPAFGLSRVLKDWQKHYGTTGKFVPWSYVRNLRDGKFKPEEILELEAELASGAGAAVAASGGVPAEVEDGPVETDRPEGEMEIRIFLASSQELRADRDAFDLYFRQQNDRLREQGFYLRIVRWENFLDAMSEAGLQEEYNQAVRESDVFVSLFKAKTGKFTEQEFDTAREQYVATGKPRIYTFFKKRDGSEKREDLKTLWAFQDKLKRLKHYQTEYEGIEHLKRQFRDQLDLLMDEWK